jgi:protein ImuB
MTPTYLSLWLPHLPTDRLRRIAPAPERETEAGLVVVAKRKGAQVIAALDRTAAAQGIRAGMTLADARAIRPGLDVAPADSPADAAALGRIADWCSRFTPLVALDAPDGLVLDIAGAAHLFGGEAALMVALEQGLGRHGFEGRAAIAKTPEAAWALARFGTLRRAPDGAGTKAFSKVFEPLPLAALRLDPDVVRIMAQAGLRHVGDLLWRPRAPLAARFGENLFARLDALMGLRKTPISPRFEAPVFVAEQRFASPITQAADVERTLLALSHHLCELMERQVVGARHLEARLFRVDGVVKRIGVGTSRPLVAGEDIARLFFERIDALGEEGLETGYGFDVVRLGVLATEAAAPRQVDLAADQARAKAEDLADLVDRLGARFGLRRVTRLMDRATHIPEFAVAAIPAAEAPARRPVPAPAPDALPSRPIRLFARPEPIIAIAEVPDGPPMRFTWRRAVHDIAAIEGPERIAPEWWAGDERSFTRDYFRAEDREGRRFWLFREGLFSAETPHPRWYVHGLFG